MGQGIKGLIKSPLKLWQTSSQYILSRVVIQMQHSTLFLSWVFPFLSLLHPLSPKCPSLDFYIWKPHILHLAPSWQVPYIPKEVPCLWDNVLQPGTASYKTTGLEKKRHFPVLFFSTFDPPQPEIFAHFSLLLQLTQLMKAAPTRLISWLPWCLGSGCNA